MALPSFAKTTVTVKRAKKKVERGVEIADWSNPSVHQIRGCSVQYRTTDMTLDLRTGVTVRAVAYFPPGADIRTGDVVVFDGTDYLIDGAPFLVQSPTGRVSHIKAALVDWEG